MNRQQFRAAQRKRVNAAQKAIAKQMGLPKGFVQFAKRHGVVAEQIRGERLKYEAV